ncbi:MAG: UvrD-helicase domain-containing protein [Calditrichaeota bacterium]|nr:UvrD-helicase domain-containing protein [Calditrichota bacterium]MCB9366383.1 UvrD-helicase domain-containing protein [Calditrichota bacterium]MCB9391987.1 UvrD-helicase domain-containing protein [Calditrichota bacterium]
MSAKANSLDGFLEGLNDAQRDAVTAETGPALVLAGAGSGKTRVLTGRALYLIERLHANPASIAVMTFTNKAARELRERLGGFEQSGRGLPWAGTFHGFCVQLLRQYGPRAGLSRDFTIYDEEDSQRAVTEILRERQFVREGMTPRQIRSVISRIKNGGKVDPRQPIVRIAEEIYEDYCVRLRQANAYDFDDLLQTPLELMKSSDEFRDILQKRFDHVLIDEFQDTNLVQFELACQIALPQNGVFAVGDDDQSIYSWRGANYRNILEFSKRLSGARVFRLEQNYRSTKHILDAANDVIAASVHRHEKTLWTDRKGGDKVTLRSHSRPADEANEIVGEIEHICAKRNLTYKDFAILFRTNAVSRYFEEVMVQQRIPYNVVGGLRFYERKEIKDLIAYLRVLANPQDEQAWARVFRELAPGVGATTIERVISAARSSGRGLASLSDPDFLAANSSGAPRVKLLEYVSPMAALRARLGELNMSETVDEALVASGLVAIYEAQDDDEARERLDNLRQFATGAWERTQATPTIALSDFLSDLALVSDIDELEDRAERVTLMTIHAAKGLEFPVVFVAGLEENLLPHARSLESVEALEEERRLLYVAMTRAMDKLYLSYSETRPLNGRLEFQSPSRYLADIHVDRLRGTGVPQRPSLRYVSMDNPEFTSDTSQEIRAPKHAWRVPAASTASRIEFRIGDVVEHQEFGVGTVTAKSGDLDSLKVRVTFTGFGSKLLAVKYANLKKLS